MLLPSRQASLGSTYNSREDIATTPASSEVDERQNVGMLASPPFTQKREASAAPSRIYHSNRENYVSSSSTSTRKPVAMYSHTRESNVEIQMFCRSLLQREKERIFTEHREIFDFLDLQSDHAAQGEKAA